MSGYLIEKGIFYVLLFYYIRIPNTILDLFTIEGTYSFQNKALSNVNSNPDEFDAYSVWNIQKRLSAMHTLLRQQASFLTTNHPPYYVL